jgi:hypothetical protein
MDGSPATGRDFFHPKFTFASTLLNYVHITILASISPPEASLVFHPYAVHFSTVLTGGAVPLKLRT